MLINGGISAFIIGTNILTKLSINDSNGSPSFVKDLLIIDITMPTTPSVFPIPPSVFSIFPGPLPLACLIPIFIFDNLSFTASPAFINPVPIFAPIFDPLIFAAIFNGFLETASNASPIPLPSFITADLLKSLYFSASLFTLFVIASDANSFSTSFILCSAFTFSSMVFSFTFSIFFISLSSCFFFSSETALASSSFKSASFLHTSLISANFCCCISSCAFFSLSN